jgi:hypothetical protein
VASTDTHAEDQQCWYAVIVGRKPGIYCGLYVLSHNQLCNLILMFVSHNITANISEVPGGFSHCYSTKELAQAAYNEALDTRKVIEVTYIISKCALSRPSVQ